MNRCAIEPQKFQMPIKRVPSTRMEIGFYHPFMCFSTQPYHLLILEHVLPFALLHGHLGVSVIGAIMSSFLIPFSLYKLWYSVYLRRSKYVILLDSPEEFENLKIQVPLGNGELASKYKKTGVANFFYIKDSAYGFFTLEPRGIEVSLRFQHQIWTLK